MMFRTTSKTASSLGALEVGGVSRPRVGVAVTGGVARRMGRTLLFGEVTGVATPPSGRLQCTLANHHHQLPVLEDHAPYHPSPAPHALPTRTLADMPGPRGLPVVGVAPRLGHTPLHLLLHWERRCHGDLFKVPLGLGRQLVVVSDPGLVQKVYRNEGAFPCRGDSLGLLGKAYDEHCPSPILAGVEGEEWKRLRVALGRPLSSRKLEATVEDLATVAEDFISAVRTSSQDEGQDGGFLPDVLPFLHKWAMEGMARFLFPQKIPFQGGQTCKMADKLTSGIIRQNQYTGRTLFYPQWILQLYRPRAYRQLCGAVQDVYSAGQHFIRDAHRSLPEDQGSNGGEGSVACLLDQWRRDDTLSEGDILTNAANIFAGGMDTTANTMAFLLHLVSAHPSVQERLQTEVRSVVGGTGPLLAHHLHRMPYLKQCVKEAMRLYPVAPLNVRRIDKELVLGNYRIPANTTYLVPTWSIGRDEKFFPDALSFRPDRWSRNKSSSVSPFLLQPFGFGPRQCFGRRMAELEMWTLLAKIVQNYTMATSDRSELDTTDLILRPSRPISFKLVRQQ